MIEITESSFTDLREMEEFLARLGANIPQATASTLTSMGRKAKDDVAKKITSIFDRPTPWTVGSTFLTSAAPAKQEARVWIRELSINSLQHHITGGMRTAKRFEKRLRSARILGAYEFAVPASRLKRDAYGNVPAATTKRILDALIGGSRSSEKIFVVKESSGGLPPGIFERVGAGSNRDLVPMMLFVSGVSYRKRYPFFEITEASALAELPAAIDKAIEAALR